METIIAVVSPLASFPASPNSISASSSQQHASHLKLTKLHRHHPRSFMPTHSFTALIEFALVCKQLHDSSLGSWWDQTQISLRLLQHAHNKIRNNVINCIQYNCNIQWEAAPKDVLTHKFQNQLFLTLEEMRERLCPLPFLASSCSVHWVGLSPQAVSRPVNKSI